VNTIIQGTAADIIKVAMIACHRTLSDAGLQTKIVLTIHDELLFEGPREETDEACEIVRHEMESAYDLDPPLKVELGVGDNWLDAK
jgi:DNA polymerase-1